MQPLGRRMPDLSAIVVSWNTRDLLARCLDALVDACQDIDLEIIVVDNASTDDTLAMLAERGDARIIANAENVGFAAANNQGLRVAHAPVALLLNSDAFVNRDAISHALQLLRLRPEAGVVGVRVLNEDGTLQAAEGSFPTLRHDLAASVGFDQFSRRKNLRTCTPASVDWVHGACMFVRLAAYREVGGLDARFFMYSEEVEWCWRFRRVGWEVWIDPSATVVHLGGASAPDDVRRRAALYRSRIGLRRRMSGPASSVCLWCGMAAGLAARVAVRGVVALVLRRDVGRQTPGSDVRLLREVARMDPLARWVTS